MWVCFMDEYYSRGLTILVKWKTHDQARFCLMRIYKFLIVYNNDAQPMLLSQRPNATQTSRRQYKRPLHRRESIFYPKKKIKKYSSHFYFVTKHTVCQNNYDSHTLDGFRKALNTEFFSNDRHANSLYHNYSVKCGLKCN